MFALLAFGAMVAGRQASATLVQTAVATEEAQAKAWLWLRVHAWDQQPQDDDLADLRTEDPSSYAIVKGLLAKKELGVLDVKHPKEGIFAATRKLSASDAATLSRMEAEVAPKAAAAAPVPEAQVKKSGSNWMNWNPSAGDDQAMAYIGSASAGEEAPTNALITEAQSLSEGRMGDQLVDQDVTGTEDYAGLRVPKIAWGDTHFRGGAEVAQARQVPSFVTPRKPKPVLAPKDIAYGTPNGIDFSVFMPASQRKPSLGMSQADAYMARGSQDLKVEKQEAKVATPAPAPAATGAQAAFNWYMSQFNAGDPAPTKGGKDAKAAQVTSLAKTSQRLRAVTAAEPDSENPYLRMMNGEATAAHPPVLALAPTKKNRYLQRMGIPEAAPMDSNPMAGLMSDLSGA